MFRIESETLPSGTSVSTSFSARWLGDGWEMAGRVQGGVGRAEVVVVGLVNGNSIAIFEEEGKRLSGRRIQGSGSVLGEMGGDMGDIGQG